MTIDEDKLSHAIESSHYTSRNFYALFGGKRRARGPRFLKRAARLLGVKAADLSKEDETTTEEEVV
jgi:hypothetical protein